MTKISLSKTFIAIALALLCAYVLFFGVRYAKINTEKSLRNTQNTVIYETDLVKAIVKDFKKIYYVIK